MPTIVWNNQWNIGIASIDADHQALVQLLNDLHNAIADNHSQTIMGRVVASLVDYTQNHFRREEGLMDQHHYWGASSQKAQHREFLAKITDVQRRFHQADDQRLGIEVLNFLRNWLIDHILQEDKPLGVFLKEKGER